MPFWFIADYLMSKVKSLLVHASHYGQIKHLFQLSLSQTTALNVRHCADTVGQLSAHATRDWWLIVSVQFYQHSDVIAEVRLRAD